MMSLRILTYRRRLLDCGTSYYVTLPKFMVKAWGLKKGDTIKMTVDLEAGKITLQPEGNGEASSAPPGGG